MGKSHVYSSSKKVQLDSRELAWEPLAYCLARNSFGFVSGDLGRARNGALFASSLAAICFAMQFWR